MLRTIKLGEADRIVTIFTQGHGKVRAVAKGDPQDGEPLRRPARADEPRRAPVLQGPRARRRHPGRDDRRRTARCARSYGCSRTRCRCSRRSTRSPRSASPTPALYRMLVGALRTLGSDAVAAGDAGVLLEAARARGLPPACSTAAPAAATRVGTVHARSTSATAACCARRARRLGGVRVDAGGARRCCAASSAAASTARWPSRRDRARARGRAPRRRRARAPLRTPTAQRRYCSPSRDARPRCLG